jgi:orotate phosphoribosyltransferase
MTDARAQLIKYISSDAVFHGDFTLTSGKKATYYVDLRKVSLDHRVAPLIGKVMLDLVQQIPNVDAVGGLTMGADPIATAVLHARSSGCMTGSPDMRGRRALLEH